MVLARPGPYFFSDKLDFANDMKIVTKKCTQPYLKTRRFSTLHMEIFEQILISGKSNRALNQQFGYTKYSHGVVDHSRKVMYKLLAMENLAKAEYHDRVVHPRLYTFWWKHLLGKHKEALRGMAIQPEFYNKVTAANNNTQAGWAGN
jgi:hypothetical protein